MRAIGRVKSAVWLLGLMFALTAWPLAASFNCAEYITTAGDDDPNYGWLIGERTESTSTTTSFAGSWSYMNFGGIFDGSSTKTSTYQVGIYQMADGTRQQLRCDGYTPV